MDVYLQPSNNELKQLWKWIHVYDLSRPILMERSFTLFGICAYMMDDYLGLGFLSSSNVDKFVYSYNITLHAYIW